MSSDKLFMDHDLQVHSRSDFERQLRLELDRAKRYRHSLGLAMLRLDRYETFLEQYGEESHAYLSQVAEAIKANTRTSDLIARYERNAIVMLFPETPLDGARDACEKLRGAVLKLKPPRADVQLTVSCGVTAYPDFGEDADDLLRSTKRCFTRAHAMGGNIVVTAGATGGVPAQLP